jgi:hypothetical protein
VLDTLDRMHRLTDLVARNRDAVRAHVEDPDRAERAVADGSAVDPALLGTLMDAGRIPRRDVPALTSTLASAVIGYHTASKFLGGPYRGTSPELFIAVLVDLVVT